MTLLNVNWKCLKVKIVYGFARALWQFPLHYLQLSANRELRIVNPQPLGATYFTLLYTIVLRYMHICWVDLSTLGSASRVRKDPEYYLERRTTQAWVACSAPSAHPRWLQRDKLPSRTGDRYHTKCAFFTINYRNLNTTTHTHPPTLSYLYAHSFLSFYTTTQNRLCKYPATEMLSASFWITCHSDCTYHDARFLHKNFTVYRIFSYTVSFMLYDIHYVIFGNCKDVLLRVVQYSEFSNHWFPLKSLVHMSTSAKI